MIEPTLPGKRRRSDPNIAALEPSPDGGAVQCQRCRQHSSALFAFCPHCGSNLNAGTPCLRNRDPLIGAVVADRYRLLSRIGVGGMGTVYKVEHVRMGKVMALKLLHGDLSRDETMVRRFSREARAISKLKGPYTVQIFDFGAADGLIYIVMEFLQGKDLGALLDEHDTIPIDRALTILEQIVTALDEAHHLGIIHRDLKPENIFVCAAKGDAAESIKVLDFGLAKFGPRDDSMVHTQRGVIMGTPHYMSPEQIDGLDVTPATDTYALSALLFRILTGRPPFPADHPLRALQAHLDAPIPAISDSDPNLAHLDNFFLRALAKEPTQRFQSATELQQAFLSYARSPHLSSPAPERATHPATQSRLVPPLSTITPTNLATHADFDRFEAWLRLRRLAAVLLSLAVLGALSWLLVWGVFMQGFTNSDLEVEPNNNTKEANPLRPGQSTIGAIGEAPPGFRADRDVYRIEGVSPGDTITLSVSAIPDLDLVLELVGANGHLLFAQNARGQGHGEHLPNFIVGEIDLFAVVREVWREGAPPQAFPDRYYLLRLDTRSPMPGEEREPNDFLADATDLNGQHAFGYIASEGDVDHFTLQRFSSPTQLDISVSGVPTADLQLALLDSHGRLLAAANTQGLAKGERLTYPLDPQRVSQPLYLRLSSQRGHSSTHPYQVEISPEPIPATP